MWIVFAFWAPGAMVAKVQSRVLLAIEQPATAGSIVHATPAGSGSWSVTVLAVPGPALLTTIVNAAVWPALIVPWSAVLTTVTSGQLTTMSASSELLSRASFGSFVAETVTSLWMFGQSPGTEARVSVIVRVA